MEFLDRAASLHSYVPLSSRDESTRRTRGMQQQGHRALMEGIASYSRIAAPHERAMSPALLLFFLEAYSIRRVLIHRNPHPADSNILWTIDSQKADRCIAYVRQPDQFRRVIVPAKMLPPVVGE